ncbi:hypothetical protein Cgig2_027492 [Carnegiea gigantea]|uniref:DUF4283 domain-containing protein n=1 Tax=Carnegiea gigantea TaxID=171969 RepID=A0A9Q1KP75_9CARY|nr:hypothetical protein Cgig2_027492 [Carnegiea gigantea]
MATGLEEAWKRLSLTMEEETVIECDDEASNDRTEQISLYLWDFLNNVWKPSKGVIIRDLDKNLFAFQSFSAVDKDFVLNKGPWASDGNFANARFWVKAIDVPPIKQTSTFAKVLGNNLSQFLGRDETSLFCAANKSVNFQVDVDITKLLQQGMHVLVKGRPIWISFKYIISSAMAVADLGTSSPPVNCIKRLMTSRTSNMGTSYGAPQSSQRDVTLKHLNKRKDVSF